jgi:hypothetical protein
MTVQDSQHHHRIIGDEIEPVGFENRKIHAADVRETDERKGVGAILGFDNSRKIVLADISRKHHYHFAPRTAKIVILHRGRLRWDAPVSKCWAGLFPVNLNTDETEHHKP